MEKTIEIPEGYEARIEGNKVILERKESEDERIRKVLINIVKGACDKYGIKYKGDEITEEKLLAYLEKQKEQKHEDWPNLSNCIKDCKKCQGKCFYRKEMYQEQENVSVSDDDKLYVEDLLSLLNFGCSTHSRNEIDMWIKSLPERLNPKPAEWSEEDEKIWQDIFELCNRFGYDDACRLLKSLRPQPKLGWRHYMWNINMRFDYSALVQYDDNQNFEIVTTGNRPKREVSDNYIFLKDICPQPHWRPSKNKDIYEIAYERYPINNRLVREVTKDINEDTRNGFIYGYNYCNSTHWKPSKEQMLALGGVLDYLEESDNEDADIIRELINDIKKL